VNRALPIALTVLGMVSIQTGAALAKRIFPVVGPEGATALRLILAAAILLLVWRPWRKPIDRRRLIWVGLYGAALGAMNLSFYLALNTVPLGIAVALELIGPLTLALVHSRHRIDLVWVALAAAGLIVLLPLTGAGAIPWTGALLALTAGGFWALYIVFGSRTGTEGHGQAVSLGMLAAAIVGAPLGLAHAGTNLLLPAVLALGLAIALLSSILPYSMELYAMNRLPTRTFGVLMSVEPAIAALSGALLLGERLTPLQWTGVVAVIAASAGSTLTGRPHAAPEA
jgi:inner membrane transporter RhtA